jgi:hypothetical protein
MGGGFIQGGKTIRNSQERPPRRAPDLHRMGYPIPVQASVFFLDMPGGGAIISGMIGRARSRAPLRQT